MTGHLGRLGVLALVLIGAIVGPEYIDLRLSECERYEINTVKQWYARHGYAHN